MKLYKVTAFPKTEFGGNKAGLVLDCEELKDDEMQEIAKELGYSETAFVLNSSVADFKVRFFTPLHEVDLCGHATIATFNTLRDLGLIEAGLYHQETKAGILELKVTKDRVFMQQQKPVFFEEVPHEDIKRCFKGNHFIHKDYPVIIGSTGLKEIFVPVVDIETLHSLKALREEIIALCVTYQVIGVHMFAFAEDCDAYSRNFAPYLGIDEESATGTSSGVLGAYLSLYKEEKEDYILRQGYSMNQPSEIYVSIKKVDSVIEEVWVGGSAKIL